MSKFTILLISLLLFNCSEYQDVEKNKGQRINITEKHLEYHENGNVKVKGDLVKGIRQNTWYSFYENGNSWSESNYLFGKKNGIYKLFYSNGNLKVHGVYENNIKTGVWFFYLENGQFEKEIDFNEIEPNEKN
ncbi:MAG: hypothetical protein P8N07_12595 [Flavobacteriales bacterium]|jgi:antitoxin component YwqK of YwqJK toxin-antitoxin module|nr:hypothetical protein [Flavobacteriales bacterium]